MATQPPPTDRALSPGLGVGLGLAEGATSSHASQGPSQAAAQSSGQTRTPATSSAGPPRPKPRPPSQSRVESGSRPGSSASTASSPDSVPESLPPPGPEERWFFKTSFLRGKLPSIRPDFPPERELKYRQRAAGFIQDMGERLNHNVKDPRARISQLCLSAAMVHMHRFYVFHPFQTFDWRDIGATALFLAGKMEDCPRKLEHIVIVWHRLKHPNEPPLNPSQEKYHQGAQLITTLENILLQTIAFDLEIRIPHPVILSKPKSLGFHLNKDLIEAAYWFASDILHMTTFCIRYRVTALAVVCFHLSSIWADTETSQVEGRPWYFSLDPDVTPALATALGKEFVAIRKAAEKEGRTKALRSTEFFKKRDQQAKEAEERQANQSGQSPLPPPPQPPPLAPPHTPATPATKHSLDHYREKRSAQTTPVAEQSPAPAAAAATPSSSSARKSFMPDMSESSIKAQKEREEREKEREKERQREKDRERREKEKAAAKHRSSAGSQGASHVSHSKRHMEDAERSASKRPRPEGQRGQGSGSHYPPHYREGKDHPKDHGKDHAQRERSKEQRERAREHSRDQRAPREGREERRGEGPRGQPPSLLPPPPLPPSGPSGGPASTAGQSGRLGHAATTPGSLFSLSSIPVPPPQPSDEDFEEGEVMDEDVPLPPGAPPPLPPGQPPALPPPPPPQPTL